MDSRIINLQRIIDAKFDHDKRAHRQICNQIDILYIEIENLRGHFKTGRDSNFNVLHHKQLNNASTLQAERIAQRNLEVFSLQAKMDYSKTTLIKSFRYKLAIANVVKNSK